MRRPGRIITFYSYKGGTGRSMAVANLGWVLAAARKRVLMMDWDLEAPGLHRYFHPFLVDPELSASRGLMDLLIDYADQAIQPPDAEAGEAGEWYRELADLTPYRVAVNFDGFPEGGRLDLVPAGRQGPGYASRLGSFDWDTFYERLGGGSFLEAVKTRLREEYEYVLIDSRTGVSDTAGICTVQMPDILVLLFTYNNQSMRGAQAVALSALDMRRKLCVQFPGQPLRICAVPSRADPFETRKLQLRQNYARRLFDPLLEQVPELERNAYWAGVEIPYSPFLSYEEVLAPLVFNAEDPKFPVAATLRLGAYLTDGEVARYDLPLSPERRQALLASFEQAEEQKPLQAAAAEESPAEALLRSADAALAQLDGERLALARRLLLRLVRLPRPSETPGLKRLRAAVFSLPAGEQELLGHFLQLGVLRLTEDREHGGAVEIADDALLARWRQVNAWAEEDKTALERRDWVQTAISYWQQAGRPDGLLLPASHARQVAPLLDSHPALFSAQEEAFIRASLAQAETPARAVAAEAPPAARAPRFGKLGLGGALAALLAVAVLLALWWPKNAVTPESNRQAQAPLPVQQSPAPPSTSDAALSFYLAGNQNLLEQRLDEAIRNYDRAIDLKPDYLEAYLSRAEAYRQQGRGDQALRELEKVVAIKPDSAEAYFKLAELNAESGRREQALDLYQRTLALGPTPQLRERAEKALAKLKPAAVPTRIYVHVNNRGDLPFAERLARQLKSSGMQVQGTQILPQATSADVRYANASDEEAARQVQRLVQDALLQAGYRGKVQLLFIGSRFQNVPPGNIEVWLPPLAAPAQQAQQAQQRYDKR
ncbi:MAG: KGGVGR-motif variant AAA ATPase [Pseudomonadota bacterium]